MKYWIPVVLMLAAVAHSAEVTGAQAELLQARTALEAGQFREALQHAARVQAFYYRDAEVLAAALYYEAAVDHKTGVSRATVSALTELKTLYPDSAWCRKAVEELEKTEQGSQ